MPTEWRSKRGPRHHGTWTAVDSVVASSSQRAAWSANEDWGARGQTGRTSPT
jgi:hypothetical protein